MASVQSTTLTVTGMTCGNCKAHVTKALADVAGVAAVDVDLAGGKAAVSFDPARATTTEMIDAVRDAGYDAKVAS